MRAYGRRVDEPSISDEDYTKDIYVPVHNVMEPPTAMTVTMMTSSPAVTSCGCPTNNPGCSWKNAQCLVELDRGAAGSVKPLPVAWNTGHGTTKRIAMLWVNGLGQDPDGSKPDGPTVYQVSHGSPYGSFPRTNTGQSDVGYYFYCYSGTHRSRTSARKCSINGVGSDTFYVDADSGGTYYIYLSSSTPNSLNYETAHRLSNGRRYYQVQLTAQERSPGNQFMGSSTYYNIYLKNSNEPPNGLAWFASPQQVYVPTATTFPKTTHLSQYATETACAPHGAWVKTDMECRSVVIGAHDGLGFLEGAPEGLHAGYFWAYDPDFVESNGTPKHPCDYQQYMRIEFDHNKDHHSVDPNEKTPPDKNTRGYSNKFEVKWSPGNCQYDGDSRGRWELVSRCDPDIDPDTGVDTTVQDYWGYSCLDYELGVKYRTMFMNVLVYDCRNGISNADLYACSNPPLRFAGSGAFQVPILNVPEPIRPPGFARFSISQDATSDAVAGDYGAAFGAAENVLYTVENIYSFAATDPEENDPRFSTDACMGTIHYAGYYKESLGNSALSIPGGGPHAPGAMSALFTPIFERKSYYTLELRVEKQNNDYDEASTTAKITILIEDGESTPALMQDPSSRVATVRETSVCAALAGRAPGCACTQDGQCMSTCGHSIANHCDIPYFPLNAYDPDGPHDFEVQVVQKDNADLASLRWEGTRSIQGIDYFSQDAQRYVHPGLSNNRGNIDATQYIGSESLSSENVFDMVIPVRDMITGLVIQAAPATSTVDNKKAVFDCTDDTNCICTGKILYGARYFCGATDYGPCPNAASCQTECDATSKLTCRAWAFDKVKKQCFTSDIARPGTSHPDRRQQPLSDGNWISGTPSSIKLIRRFKVQYKNAANAYVDLGTFRGHDWRGEAKGVKTFIEGVYTTGLRITVLDPTSAAQIGFRVAAVKAPTVRLKCPGGALGCPALDAEPSTVAGFEQTYSLKIRVVDRATPATVFADYASGDSIVEWAGMTITVVDVNEPPVISQANLDLNPDRNVYEDGTSVTEIGVRWEFELVCTDPEEDAVIIDIVSQAHQNSNAGVSQRQFFEIVNPAIGSDAFPKMRLKSEDDACLDGGVVVEDCRNNFLGSYVHPEFDYDDSGAGLKTITIVMHASDRSVTSNGNLGLGSADTPLVGAAVSVTLTVENVNEEPFWLYGQVGAQANGATSANNVDTFQIRQNAGQYDYLFIEDVAEGLRPGHEIGPDLYDLVGDPEENWGSTTFELVQAYSTDTFLVNDDVPPEEQTQPFAISGSRIIVRSETDFEKQMSVEITEAGVPSSYRWKTYGFKIRMNDAEHTERFDKHLNIFVQLVDSNEPPRIDGETGRVRLIYEHSTEDDVAAAIIDVPDGSDCIVVDDDISNQEYLIDKAEMVLPKQTSSFTIIGGNPTDGAGLALFKLVPVSSGVTSANPWGSDETHSAFRVALQRPDLNFEMQNEYTLKVTIADDGYLPTAVSNTGATMLGRRLVREFSLVVQILDQNDAPSAPAFVEALSEFAVENQTVVGLLSVVDEDEGDVHRFALMDAEKYKNNGRPREDGINGENNGNTFKVGEDEVTGGPTLQVGVQGWMCELWGFDKTLAVPPVHSFVCPRDLYQGCYEMISAHGTVGDEDIFYTQGFTARGKGSGDYAAAGVVKNTAQGDTLHLYVMMTTWGTEFEAGDTLYTWPMTPDGFLLGDESTHAEVIAIQYQGWTHQECYQANLKNRGVYVKDGPSNGAYTLKLNVTDTGPIADTSPTAGPITVIGTVTINIIDENDDPTLSASGCSHVRTIDEHTAVPLFKTLGYTISDLGNERIIAEDVDISTMGQTLTFTINAQNANANVDKFGLVQRAAVAADGLGLDNYVATLLVSGLIDFETLQAAGTQYRISEGPDDFSILDDTFGYTLDLEVRDSAEGGGSSTACTIKVVVENVNEPPCEIHTFISNDGSFSTTACAYTVTPAGGTDGFEIEEVIRTKLSVDGAADRVVGSVSTTDPDMSSGDVLEFSMATEPGQNPSPNPFDVTDTDPQTGAVAENGVTFLITTANPTLTTGNPVPDFEVKQSYDVKITVTDAGGLFSSGFVTIQVVDVNDPPTGSDAQFFLPENSKSDSQELRTTLGAVSAHDEDGPLLAYSLTGRVVAQQAFESQNCFSLDTALGRLAGWVDGDGNGFSEFIQFNEVGSTTLAFDLTSPEAAVVQFKSAASDQLFLYEVRIGPINGDAGDLYATIISNDETHPKLTAGCPQNRPGLNCVDSASYHVEEGTPAADTPSITAASFDQFTAGTFWINLDRASSRISVGIGTDASAASTLVAKDIMNANTARFVGFGTRSGEGKYRQICFKHDPEPAPHHLFSLDGVSAELSVTPLASLVSQSPMDIVTGHHSTAFDFETQDLYGLLVEVSDSFNGASGPAMIHVHLRVVITDVNEPPLWDVSQFSQCGDAILACPSVFEESVPGVAVTTTTPERGATDSRLRATDVDDSALLTYTLGAGNSVDGVAAFTVVSGVDLLSGISPGLIVSDEAPILDHERNSGWLDIHVLVADNAFKTNEKVDSAKAFKATKKTGQRCSSMYYTGDDSASHDGWGIKAAVTACSADPLCGAVVDDGCNGIGYAKCEEGSAMVASAGDCVYTKPVVDTRVLTVAGMIRVEIKDINESPEPFPFSGTIREDAASDFRIENGVPCLEESQCSDWSLHAFSGKDPDINQVTSWGTGSHRWFLVSIDENILHRGALVMATSEAASTADEWSVKNVLDDDPETSWKSSAATSGANKLTIDLQKVYEIESMHILFKGGKSAEVSVDISILDPYDTGLKTAFIQDANKRPGEIGAEAPTGDSFATLSGGAAGCANTDHEEVIDFSQSFDISGYDIDADSRVKVTHSDASRVSIYPGDRVTISGSSAGNVWANGAWTVLSDPAPTPTTFWISALESGHIIPGELRDPVPPAAGSSLAESGGKVKFSFREMRVLHISFSNDCNTEIEIAGITIKGPTPLKLNWETGELRVISPMRLDYESMTSYDVVARVTDKLGQLPPQDELERNEFDSFAVDVDATITITNANEAPTLAHDMTFVPKYFTGRRRVFENSPAGTAVGDPCAMWDPDWREAQPLEFEITAQERGNVFRIHACSGQVSVDDSGAQGINFETYMKYTLNLKIRDNPDAGLTSLSDSSLFYIEVIDVNEVPALVPAQRSVPEAVYELGVRVYEAGGSHAKDVVGTALTAVDDDNFRELSTCQEDGTGCDKQVLSFHIMNGNDRGVFTILDPVSGVIQLSGIPPDLEQQSLYDLVIKVEDDGILHDMYENEEQGIPLESRASIQISIIDINDHPICPEHSLLGVAAAESECLADAVNRKTCAAFSIVENAGPGTPVEGYGALFKSQDIDNDPPQDLTYSIDELTSFPAEDVFQIEADSGKITVRNGGDVNIDMDTYGESFARVHSFQVRVKDSGTPVLDCVGLVRVQVVDINEPPLVTDTAYMVSELGVVGEATAARADRFELYYESRKDELVVQRCGTFDDGCKGASPFSAIDVGWHAKPIFADFDQDDDIDLLVGDIYGHVHYYENTGTHGDLDIDDLDHTNAGIWYKDVETKFKFVKSVLLGQENMETHYRAAPAVVRQGLSSLGVVLGSGHRDFSGTKMRKWVLKSGTYTETSEWPGASISQQQILEFSTPKIVEEGRIVSQLFSAARGKIVTSPGDAKTVIVTLVENTHGLVRKFVTAPDACSDAAALSASEAAELKTMCTPYDVVYDVPKSVLCEGFQGTYSSCNADELPRLRISSSMLAVTEAARELQKIRFAAKKILTKKETVKQDCSGAGNTDCAASGVIATATDVVEGNDIISIALDANSAKFKPTLDIHYGSAGVVWAAADILSTSSRFKFKVDDSDIPSVDLLQVSDLMGADGSPATGSFPLSKLNLTKRLQPQHTDFIAGQDGDPISVMFVGDSMGRIHRYNKNTADPPSFYIKETLDLTALDCSPDLDCSKLRHITPCLYDFDLDGYTDIIFGAEDGHVYFMKQNGADESFENPVRIQKRNSITQAIEDIDVGAFSAPAIADLNGEFGYGDRIPDLVVGEEFGHLHYFISKGQTDRGAERGDFTSYATRVYEEKGFQYIMDIPVKDVEQRLETATFTYNLVGGNTNNDFALDGSTGRISIANALNFEDQSYYELSVQVTDKGISSFGAAPGAKKAKASGIVRIAIYDEQEAPILRALDVERTILENSNINVILTGGAILYDDPDEIDRPYAKAVPGKSSGQIKRFEIDTTDGKISSQHFKVNTVLKGSGLDMADCGGTGPDFFAPCAIIKTKRDDLNFEDQEKHTIYVRILDSATPVERTRRSPELYSAGSLDIRVLDVNEPPSWNDNSIAFNLPTFAEFSESGDSDIGESLLKYIDDEDRDESFTFRIVSVTGDLDGSQNDAGKPYRNYFMIGPTTGQLMIVADNAPLKDGMREKDFNYEISGRHNQYKITTEVRDSGGLTQENVVVLRATRGNTKPRLGDQTFNSEENVCYALGEPQSVCGASINVPERYIIASNLRASAMVGKNAETSAQERSGSNQTIWFEINNVYRVDHRRRDIDDDSNSTTGMFIRPSDLFFLEPETGTIQVIGHLNFETSPQYILSLSIKDTGTEGCTQCSKFCSDCTNSLESTASVVITIVDLNEPPAIGDEERQVVENIQHATILGAHMIGEDEDFDEQVKYTINSTTEHPFITRQSFEPLKDNKGLVSVDLEDNDYGFTGRPQGNKRAQQQLVHAIDTLECDTHAGHISLQCSPAGGSSMAEASAQFEKWVRRGDLVQVGFQPPKLVASADKDLLIANFSENHLYNQTGAPIKKITSCLTCGLGLDFESVPGYRFLVTISDDGVPPLIDTGMLVVKVIDTNEPPWFVLASLMSDGTPPEPFLVVENSPGGTHVGTPIVADDQDDGSSLTFSIDSRSDPERRFQILPIANTSFPFLAQIIVSSVDRCDGTTTCIDYEVQQEYSLEVVVADNFGAEHRARVPVRVIDVNDLVVDSVYLINSDGSPASESRLRTAGKQRIRIEGKNFGMINNEHNNEYQRIQVDLSNVAAAGDVLGIAGAFTNCVRVPRDMNTRIECDTPEGHGSKHTIRVTVYGSPYGHNKNKDPWRVFKALHPEYETPVPGTKCSYQRAHALVSEQGETIKCEAGQENKTLVCSIENRPDEKGWFPSIRIANHYTRISELDEALMIEGIDGNATFYITGFNANRSEFTLKQPFSESVVSSVQSTQNVFGVSKELECDGTFGDPLTNASFSGKISFGRIPGVSRAEPPTYYTVTALDFQDKTISVSHGLEFDVGVRALYMIRPSAVDSVLLDEAATRLGYPFAAQSALDTAMRKANYLADSGERDCGRDRDKLAIAICLRDDEFTRWWSSEGLATSPEEADCTGTGNSNMSTCVQRGSGEFWAWLSRWNAMTFEEGRDLEVTHAGRDRDLDYGNFVHISCNTNPETKTAMCGNNGSYVDAITSQASDIKVGDLVQVGDASSSGPCRTEQDCYFLHLYPLWRVASISKASFDSNVTFNDTYPESVTTNTTTSFTNGTTNVTEFVTSTSTSEVYVTTLNWRIDTHYTTNFTLEQAWDGDSNYSPHGRCCHPDSNAALPNISLPTHAQEGQLIHVVRTSERHFSTNTWEITSKSPNLLEYIKPSIVRINGTQRSGDAQLMSTEGNQLITIVGDNFGKLGLTNPVVTVEYGPPGKFFFCNHVCTVTVAHTEIVCNSTSGVGSGHVWRAYVGHHFDALTRIPGPASTATSSYAPPSIASAGITSPDLDLRGDLFPSIAIAHLDTRGDDTVIIAGTNFGPTSYRFSGCYGAPQVDPLARVGASYRRDRNPAKSAWHQKTYTANICTVTKDHVEMTCKTTEGSGKGHRWTVVVGAQSSMVSNQTVGYRLPKIFRVFGPSVDSLATSGGETILLSGDFFGPLSLVRDEVASIKYGHHATAWDSNDRHYPPYFTHCEVILAHTLMQCISVEGTGKNLSLALEVDEQHSHIEPNARRESVGYGQPIVFDISTVHSVSLAEADTRGTDVAVISGKNFGVMINNRTDIIAIYANEAYRRSDFDGFRGYLRGRDCEVSVAHFEARCLLSEGAGNTHAWSIEVDGQNSTNPTSAYHIPQILNITGPGASDADGNGGQWVLITGLNFGPSRVHGKPSGYLESVTYGEQGRGYVSCLRGDKARPCFSAEELTDSPDAVFTPLPFHSQGPGCVHIDHFSINCTTVPGVGAKLYWEVKVRGQINLISESGTTGYARPNVELIIPAVVGTRPEPEDRILLKGTNFGLPTTFTEAELSFNFTSQPIGTAGIASILPPDIVLRSTGGKLITRVLPDGDVKVGAKHQSAVAIPELSCNVDCNASNFMVAAITTSRSKAMQRSEAYSIQYKPPQIDYIHVSGSGNERKLTVVGSNFGKTGDVVLTTALSSSDYDWSTHTPFDEAMGAACGAGKTCDDPESPKCCPDMSANAHQFLTCKACDPPESPKCCPDESSMLGSFISSYDHEKIEINFKSASREAEGFLSVDRAQQDSRWVNFKRPSPSITSVKARFVGDDWRTDKCTVKEGGTNPECFAANADQSTCEGKNTGVADANKCEFFANIKFDTVGWGGHRDEDDGGFPPGFASGDSADLLQLTCENCNLCDKDGICDSKEARLKLSICVGKNDPEDIKMFNPKYPARKCLSAAELLSNGVGANGLAEESELVKFWDNRTDYTSIANCIVVPGGIELDPTSSSRKEVLRITCRPPAGERATMQAYLESDSQRSLPFSVHYRAPEIHYVEVCDGEGDACTNANADTCEDNECKSRERHLVPTLGSRVRVHGINFRDFRTCCIHPQWLPTSSNIQKKTLCFIRWKRLSPVVQPLHAARRHVRV